MSRVRWSLAAVAAVALVSCKSPQGSDSQVKDIESVKKVTLIQGTDGQGNSVAFITCADGFIDKAAKKAEFAVPWSKVSNLSYTEMEAIYCTEPAGGAIVVTPPPGGGGTTPPPPPGGGGAAGDFVQLDTGLCKSQENVDLPNVAEVKRVYLEGSITDSYDKCIVFGVELENLLAKLKTIKKALVDKKVRIYAGSASAFNWDAGANKMTLPYQLKDKAEPFIATAAKIDSAFAGSFTVPSNPGLVWRAFPGNTNWAQAKANCDGLGAPWAMPARVQLATVAPDFTADKIKARTGDLKYYEIWIIDGQNQEAAPPFGQTSNYDKAELGSFCVIDFTK